MATLDGAKIGQRLARRRLIEKFPQSGPKVVWRTKIAGGYSGPAVAAGRVVINDYVTSDNVKVDNFQRETYSGQERILCLDEATGDILWQHEYPVQYSISYPAGPRCTPIIEDGKVYTLGAEGHLFCFDLGDGEIIWEHDLTSEYETKAALWGYAAHPLIDGDKLITLVGGEGSHAVAFNKETGEEIWKTLTSPEQGYAPPVIIEAAGKRQLILARPDAVTAVDPETGKEYWSVPYEATNGSIIMTPIKSGDFLYVAGYSNKNLLLKLNQDTPGAEEVYRDLSRKGIAPINVQPIADEDVLYGFDQNGQLYCMDIETGERIWNSTAPLGDRPLGSGTAFIVRQGERYWMFNEHGELIICKLSKEGYEEVDRAEIIKPTNVAFGRDVVWCQPAFANRKVYVRNDEEIICVDVAK